MMRPAPLSLRFLFKNGVKLGVMLLGFGVILTVAFLLMNRSPAEKPQLPVAVEPVSLTMSAPVQVSAGWPIPIEISTNLPDQTPLLVTMHGSYGTYTAAVTVKNSAASLTIPGLKSRSSGHNILTIHGEGVLVEQGIEIIPHAAVEPLRPLVGPGSIPADGSTWTMLFALPFDLWGNPIPEGSEVEFTVQRPDGTILTFEEEIEHLLAWTLYEAGTVAGRTRISLTAHGAFGTEETLLEIPGRPVNIQISHEPEALVADGRSLTTLLTNELKDRFGNVLAEGTQVTMVVTDQSGKKSYLPTTVIKGRAQITFVAPSQPDTLEVKLVVFGQESGTHRIVYDTASAVGHIPVRLTEDEASTGLAVQAGPILGELGQYTPDGQIVEITIAKENGADEPLLFIGRVKDGYALVPFRTADLTEGSYTITTRASQAEGQVRIYWPSNGEITTAKEEPVE